MIFDKKLYHGSYTKVENPSLKMCMEGKDFGKGFYVTTDMPQAERFLKTSVKKAEKNGVTVDETKGYINIYELPSNKSLRVYEFKSADRDWLHCITAHRKKGELKNEIYKWADYDVIVGKIANDTTNQVITAYLNGLYGEVGSESADEIAIRLLLPEKLKNQICLRTQKAIDALVYLGCEERSIKAR